MPDISTPTDQPVVVSPPEQAPLIHQIQDQQIQDRTTPVPSKSNVASPADASNAGKTEEAPANPVQSMHPDDPNRLIDQINRLNLAKSKVDENRSDSLGLKLLLGGFNAAGTPGLAAEVQQNMGTEPSVLVNGVSRPTLPPNASPQQVAAADQAYKIAQSQIQHGRAQWNNGVNTIRKYLPKTGFAPSIGIRKNLIDDKLAIELGVRPSFAGGNGTAEYLEVVTRPLSVLHGRASFGVNVGVSRGDDPLHPNRILPTGGLGATVNLNDHMSLEAEYMPKMSITQGMSNLNLKLGIRF